METSDTKPTALQIATQSIKAEKPVAKTPSQTPVKPIPTVSTPVAKPSTSTVTVTKEPVKESNYTLNDVITMQDMITSLSNTMVRNADNISTSKGISKEDVINYATSFKNMGKKYSGQNDGVWGSNTNSALQNINNFLFKIKSNLKVELGSGDYPFKGDKEELKKLAINNTDVIVKIFGELGISKPTDQTKQTILGSSGEYDLIKETLSNSDIKDPLNPAHQGNIKVMPEYLADLQVFLRFVSTLKVAWPDFCAPLGTGYKDKQTVSKQETNELSLIAATVLESSIYKLAEEIVPEDVVVENEPEETGLCYWSLINFLTWFGQRANAVYTASLDLDKKQKELAAEYQSKINGLKNQWKITRPYVIKSLQDNGLNNKPIITHQVLSDAVSGLIKDHKSGRLKAPNSSLVSTRNDRETGFTQETGDRDIDKGPIQRSMDLEDVRIKYERYLNKGTLNLAEKIREVSRLGRLPTLVDSVWSNSANWENIANRFINAPTNVEAQNYFVKYANMIKAFLSNVLQDWESDPGVAKRIDMDNKEGQDKLLYNWLGYTDRLIREAEYRARNPRGTQDRKW